MRQYKRMKQKRLNLLSMNFHTILLEDERRWASCKTIEGTTLLYGRKDDGEGGNNTSGSGPKNWGDPHQHQQSDAPERCCELGIFAEDRRKHRARCRNEDSADKVAEVIGDVA